MSGSEPHELTQLRNQLVIRFNQTVTHPGGTKYDDAEATTRQVAEEEDALRLPFQVDQERIVLCKAFRRLKHKTQVFWAPRNDHFRTRLTHTIEVAQTARLVGSLLGLNVDLCEAIAYGHDIGHPPFGHAGERSLSNWIDEWKTKEEGKESDKQNADYQRFKDFGFDHHEFAHRLLQMQELQPYTTESTKGLNLTNAVAEGIANPSLDNKLLEAEVVAVADDIAWINHDQEDFQQAGINVPEDVFNAIRHFGTDRKARIIRAVEDVVSNSLGQDQLHISEELHDIIERIREAYHDIYLHDENWKRHEEGAMVVIGHLADFYMYSPIEEVEKVLDRMIGRGSTGRGGAGEHTIIKKLRNPDIPRFETVVDHLAKMTDTFALDLYRHLYSPETLDYYF